MKIKTKIPTACWNEIVDWVCMYFGFSKKHFLSRKRTREDMLVQSRQMVMSGLYRLSCGNLGVSKIGTLFTNPLNPRGYDHATVTHSIRTVDDLCLTDKEFEQNYNAVEIGIKNILKRYNRLPQKKYIPNKIEQAFSEVKKYIINERYSSIKWAVIKKITLQREDIKSLNFLEEQVKETFAKFLKPYDT